MRYHEPKLEILVIGDDVITASSGGIQETPAGGNNEGGDVGTLFPNAKTWG